MLNPSLRIAALAAIVAALASTAPSCAAPADTSLFTDLSGAWSGSGTLTLASGQKERLRCKARYVVQDGNKALEQHLRCASDSYRFDVDSTLSYNAEAGLLSGKWAELNYGVGGFVTGRLTGTQIQAKVDGGGFNAAIGVSLRGGQQAVTIRSENTTIEEVSVTLRRA